MQLQLGHYLATKLFLMLSPPFPTTSLFLCSWQTPRHPHTHGRSWEDCVGGAGHEVRDLSEGPDVGGVVALLHLLLDEAFQLLPERLQQAKGLVPCSSWKIQGPIGPHKRARLHRSPGIGAQLLAELRTLQIPRS